jgi:hypothetical protein
VKLGVVWRLATKKVSFLMLQHIWWSHERAKTLGLPQAWLLLNCCLVMVSDGGTGVLHADLYAGGCECL